MWTRILEMNKRNRGKTWNMTLTTKILLQTAAKYPQNMAKEHGQSVDCIKYVIEKVAKNILSKKIAIQIKDKFVW